jgi:hypothetical protein
MTTELGIIIVDPLASSAICTPSLRKRIMSRPTRRVTSNGGDASAALAAALLRLRLRSSSAFCLSGGVTEETSSLYTALRPIPLFGSACRACRCRPAPFSGSSR